MSSGRSLPRSASVTRAHTVLGRKRRKGSSCFFSKWTLTNTTRRELWELEYPLHLNRLTRGLLSIKTIFSKSVLWNPSGKRIITISVQKFVFKIPSVSGICKFISNQVNREKIKICLSINIKLSNEISALHHTAKTTLIILLFMMWRRAVYLKGEHNTCSFSSKSRSTEKTLVGTAGYWQPRFAPLISKGTQKFHIYSLEIKGMSRQCHVKYL